MSEENTQTEAEVAEAPQAEVAETPQAKSEEAPQAKAEAPATHVAVETGDGRGHRKERDGVVVKAKADKTVVVQVSRRVKHPRYSKYVTRRRRYAAHCTVEVEVGDFVKIQETRPMSKTKRWRVLGKTVKHY